MNLIAYVVALCIQLLGVLALFGHFPDPFQRTILAIGLMTLSIAFECISTIRFRSDKIEVYLVKISEVVDPHDVTADEDKLFELVQRSKRAADYSTIGNGIVGLFCIIQLVSVLSH